MVWLARRNRAISEVPTPVTPRNLLTLPADRCSELSKRRDMRRLAGAAAAEVCGHELPRRRQGRVLHRINRSDTKGTTRSWVRLVVAAVATLAAILAATPSVQAKASRPSSVHDRLAALENAHPSRYGIRQFKWVPAAGGLPAYAFVLGCLDCDGATYDANGTLTNSTALARIPTSWILRVPENYRQRLVAQVPFGEADQTNFSPYLQTLLVEGDAVAVMDHPSPGFAKFSYDQFVAPPFHTTDYANGYKNAGEVLKRLLSDLGIPSLGSYLLSSSRGTLLGGGLLAGDVASPFDGSVLFTGGDGELPLLQSLIGSLRTDRLVPLTYLKHQLTVTDVTTLIGRADPEYRAQVLAGTVNALDYDVTNRPEQVQEDWRALSYDGHLQGRTIVIQGLHDRTVWPGGNRRLRQRHRGRRRCRQPPALLL